MIDLRSDTMTQPSEAMREAMKNAQVGDDMYGEDPTIIELEQKAAKLLGKPAALFVVACSQANLIAQLVQCRRGEEILCAENAHVHSYEQAAASSLAGVRTRPCVTHPDGTFELIDTLINPDDVHFPRTGMLWLEQTYWGKVLPIAFHQEAASYAKKHGLKLHIDGARLFNAAAKLDVSAASLVSDADSVSICLSKGLGAPGGSLFCGSKELVEEGRRWRKALGGNWRQGGMLAAAGIVALDERDDLKQDHEKVAKLKNLLKDTPGITVHNDGLGSNMLFLTFEGKDHGVVAKQLEQEQIRVLPMRPFRLAFHKDVPMEAVDKIYSAINHQ